jgi:hypothetical protein
MYSWTSKDRNNKECVEGYTHIRLKEKSESVS